MTTGLQIPAGNTGRQVQGVKSDELSLSWWDHRAIMHTTDLLLHSREGILHICQSSLYGCIVFWKTLIISVDAHSWNTVSSAHLLNKLELLWIFFKCVSNGPHTYSHTAISQVLAQCIRLFPVDKYGWDDALWSLRAETVFFRSWQDVRVSCLYSGLVFLTQFYIYIQTHTQTLQQQWFKRCLATRWTPSAIRSNITHGEEG